MIGLGLGLGLSKSTAGGIGGASYLPDTGAVFADTAAEIPAAFGGSIARVNPSGGQSINALQPSASLRPLLGRAIKGQRVNLIAPSEQFNIQPWTHFSSVQVIPNATTPPPQQLAASKIYPLSSGLEKFLVLLVHSLVPTGSSNVCFFTAKKAEKSVAYITDAGGAADKVCYFNLNTGIATLGSFGSSPFMIDAGDGWWICGYVRPTNGQWLEIGVADAVGSTFVTANGTDGIFIGGVQINLGTVRLPYQAIGVNAITVTEAGVPSYPFVRFDLSDDRLYTVLPQAVTGDVVIAGRNGSVIAPHSYAANTTFQLGPTSYTGGTPGILSAIGDVVGWSILDKTLTAAERERLMRFYEQRGAKGLLVPGPELVVNGGFDTPANWSAANVTIAAGVAQFPGGGVEGSVSQTIALLPNSVYLIGLSVTGTTGTSARVRFGGQTNSGFVNFSGNGGLQAVLIAPSGSTQIQVHSVSGTFNGAVDNVSVRELRPEEEW